MAASSSDLSGRVSSWCSCAGCKKPLTQPEDFYIDGWDKVWNLCHDCGPMKTPARTTP